MRRLHPLTLLTANPILIAMICAQLWMLNGALDTVADMTAPVVTGTAPADNGYQSAVDTAAVRAGFSVRDNRQHRRSRQHLQQRSLFRL